MKRKFIKKISEKQREKNRIKAEKTAILHELFRKIWDEREDSEGYCYCFETGQAMHGSQYRSNTACYDHVLEKNVAAFPQYAFTKKNIIIVHPDVHQQKGSDIDKVPRIKKYREYLLSLHYKDELKD